MNKALELAEKLTKLRARVEVAGGRVTRLYRYYEVEKGVWAEEDFTEEQLAELGVDPELGYLDDHPEGADRGGYVPFVLSTHTWKLESTGNEYQYRVYFDQGGGEWFPS